ncbi:MAG: quinone-dependent dihydroorotate dehydrogenase [Sphingomonadales bacterium]|jgi:dihydroorotate dehydrogenase
MLYSLIRPFLMAMDAEDAHGLTIKALKKGWVKGRVGGDDPILRTKLGPLDLPNPIGLAAGFDKNAEVMDAMLGLGFGFVEAGTITPKPQAGNPKPRIFRLKEDRAVINRLGFNNGGLEMAALRFAARAGNPGIVGANVGANKDADDRIADYETGIRRLAPLATYLTINISSPNTPGLRALQSRASLEDLLKRSIAARGENKAPIFLKIAPDLTDEDRQDIAEVALNSGVDGLIVSNTTIERPESLKSANAKETGGLSGAPLMVPSTQVLADIYKRTSGQLPIIGVGGAASGADAYAKIRAGASAVQLYTALVYHGPGLVKKIKQDLAALLHRDGFKSVKDAVGADHF